MIAVIACLLVAGVLVFETRVLLLGFAGVLGAVFLMTPARWVARVTRLPYWAGLMIVCFVVLAVPVLAGWLIGARVADQTDELQARIPEMREHATHLLRGHAWGRWILHGASAVFSPTPDTASPGATRSMLADATTVARSVGGTASGVVVVGFVALFGAIAPGTYRELIVRVIPRRRAHRARQVLRRIRQRLWWWLVGQLVAMLFIGIVTAVALWAFGLSLWLSLAVIAALLNFVPNFGPLLAAAAAVILALVERPHAAGFIAATYVAIQILQNHIVTPLVQQRAVHLPPVVLILAQVFMFYWSGALGILLAPPLAVVCMTLVEMLYVQDVLGKAPTGRNHQRFWRRPGQARADAARKTPSPSAD